MPRDQNALFLLLVLAAGFNLAIITFGIRRTTSFIKKKLTARGWKIHKIRGPYIPAFHPEFQGILYKSQFAVIMHVEDLDGNKYQYLYAIGDLGFGLLFNQFSLIRISADA